MTENKHCYDCRYYKPYFVKGHMKFDRLDYGICAKNNEGKEKHEGCACFSHKYYGRANRREAALAALTEHINVLAEIKQILDDSEEEALEEFLFARKLQKERERKRSAAANASKPDEQK